MRVERGPAYRIETERTRLRCFAPSDAAMLGRAIEESLEVLVPWMPWARHEPVSFEERVTWLRTQRGNFDLGVEYVVGIFDKQETRILGSAGLVRGDIDEREIGYWIHAQHQGRGLATEVTAALIRVGFDIEALETIEIRCDVRNQKSARVPEKLGFAEPLLEPLSVQLPDGDKGDAHVYVMPRVLYAESPARRAKVEAYDVLDRRIL